MQTGIAFPRRVPTGISNSSASSEASIEAGETWPQAPAPPTPRTVTAGAPVSKKLFENRTHFVSYHVDETNYDHADENISLLPPRMYHTLIAVVIFANGAQMGWCAKEDMFGTSCFFAEVVFTCIFLFEMVLKLHAQKIKYFKSPWNVVDFALVFSTVLDLAIIMLSASCETCEPLGILRLPRLLRAIRLLRVLRAKRQLAVLFEGLMSSLKAMLWVGCLLGVFVYAGGIFCFTAFGDATEIWEDNYFESLFSSMLTMCSLSLMDNWSDIVLPISTVQPVAVSFFLIYTFVTSLGILNLLIGIITEETMRAAAKYERANQVRLHNASIEAKLAAIDELAELAFLEESGEYANEVSPTETERWDQTLLANVLHDVDLPPGLTVADLHLICSPNKGMNKTEMIEALRQLTLGSGFQREVLVQHSLNDIRRRFSQFEKKLEVIDARLTGIASGRSSRKASTRLHLESDPVNDRAASQIRHAEFVQGDYEDVLHL